MMAMCRGQPNSSLVFQIIVFTKFFYQPSTPPGPFPDATHGCRAPGCGGREGRHCALCLECLCRHFFSPRPQLQAGYCSVLLARLFPSSAFASVEPTSLSDALRSPHVTVQKVNPASCPSIKLLLHHVLSPHRYHDMQILPVFSHLSEHFMHYFRVFV